LSKKTRSDPTQLGPT